MKPGNPSVISEWLSRSKKVPLTVIAEFTDTFEHLPCRYQVSATATLADNDDPEVCPRHKAVLSLDQLLPHRSRISDLNVSLHSSDPDWDDYDHNGEPELLNHSFFRKTLPNLQRLDFRAAHIEQTRYVVPIPDLLFAGELPRLEELKYLGVAGGLTKTAKNLVSCEIGFWSESAGPTIIAPDELQALFYNNKTVKSLTISDFGFFADSDPWVPTAIPMTDLKCLEIHCPVDDDLEKIVNCIHAPQFENLNTAQLSLYSSNVQVAATDGSGHTFKFSQPTKHFRFHPLRHLGADITTLRLGREITLQLLDENPALYGFFLSLDAVQVLEFDGTAASFLSNMLSVAGVFPGLEVIRVAINRDDCKGALRLLATGLRLRMEGGNPLTTIEPLSAEVEDGLCQELRVEWEKHYEAGGIQNFLSK